MEAQVDGLAVHYGVHGDGPPEVVLHGMGSSFEQMGHQVGWRRCRQAVVEFFQQQEQQQER